MEIGDIIEIRGRKHVVTQVFPDVKLRGEHRLGQKESRVPCPICARPVGGVHTDACPRSRAALRALPKSEPRIAYLSKGVGLVAGPNGEPRVVSNPGFPYVRPRKGVSWATGGLPLGMDKQTALAYMRREAERATKPVEAPQLPTLTEVLCAAGFGKSGPGYKVKWRKCK